MSVFNDDIVEMHKPITLRADDGLSVPNDDEVNFDYYNEENDNIEDIVDSAKPDKKQQKVVVTHIRISEMISKKEK